MNVESNLGELEQIVEALDQKHDALSSGGAEVLPELQAVNKLYNRLRELTEEHERNHDLSLEEVHQAYDRVRGRAATAMRVGRLTAGRPSSTDGYRHVSLRCCKSLRRRNTP